MTDADADAGPDPRYRPCVGVMLLNAEGLIFAGRRIDNSAEAWQMPQGGVDPGEAPQAAAFRELAEETGVPADKARLLRESATWIPYDLPPDLASKLWGGRYLGQTQRWFAMRFEGVDADVNIATEEPEFQEWRWMTAPEMMAAIVPFKRETYGRVLAEFGDLIG